MGITSYLHGDGGRVENIKTYANGANIVHRVDTQKHRMSAAISGSEKEFRVEGFCIFSHIIESQELPSPRGGRRDARSCAPFSGSQTALPVCCSGRATKSRRRASSPKASEVLSSNSRDVL